MSDASKQNENARPFWRRWTWKKVYIYIIFFVVFAFIFGEKNTGPVTNKGGLQPSVGALGLKRPNMEYEPFAKRGDLYTILLTSGSDGVFAEDTFSNLIFDDDTKELSRHYSIDLHQCYKENRSVVLTVKMRIKGKEYSQEFPMVRFLPSRRKRQKRHLFFAQNKTDGDMNNVTETETNADVWKPYFQPSLTLSPIIDFSNPLPPDIRSYYYVDKATEKYLPLLYINNFWVLRDHLVELNASTVSSPINFTIKVSPLPLWKLVLYVNYELSMKQHQALGLMREEDSDETKRIFLETNPYFLCLTFVVMILHMLFEYLAFSNDIKFWRHRKNCKGLSLRTIVMNCYFKTIIFLYLLDSDKTSWSILIPSGIGVIVEYWKVKQITRFVRSEGGRLWCWRVEFSDGYDKHTRKHDDLAVRYLMYAMTPALFCYTFYLAVFDTHDGWYSFLIKTQVRFIYLFGFAMLTPQIFINYKMKTVAQLPWRTFVYRALNTIIDDLFAFIVKMPWMHRLACFRDDIVFLVLLYQRWIYPVDASRSEGSDADSGHEENEKQEICLKNDENRTAVDAATFGSQQALIESKKKQ